MGTGNPRFNLVGRQRECEVLDRLLADVHVGRSRVLILHGEAGVGKSALLDHLAHFAAGVCVARVVGVESEFELAFSGLTSSVCRSSTGWTVSPHPNAGAQHGLRPSAGGASRPLPPEPG